MQETIRQQKQATLYQTADEGDSLPDSEMQETLYQTADAGDSL